MKNGHCTWLCAFGVPIQVVCAGEEAGGGTAIYGLYMIYEVWAAV